MGLTGNIRKRSILYILLIIAVILGYTMLYSWGMQTFEGEERGFKRSLQMVAETVTTTGYGEDSPWQSTEMTVLMVTMQFSGVIIVFMALPLIVVPWIERTIEQQVPTSARDLEDHIIVCGYQFPHDDLAERFESKDVDYVFIEREQETALELHKEGIRVMQGDPESIEVVKDAGIEAAESIVIDDTDERTASIVLSAREANSEIQAISIVDNPSNTSYLRYAGADKVLSPHFLLGLSLADKVTTAVTARLGDMVDVGEDFKMVELPIQEGSDLEGKRFSETRIRQRTGASVIGVWIGGEFVSPIPDDLECDDDTVLLVAGREPQLQELKEMASVEDESIVRRRKKVIIAGYGDVGYSTYAVLKSAGLSRTVVDIQKEEVDIVGDATEEKVLRDAGIEDASALIIALPDDTDAVFATLVARNINPDIEIITRANNSANVNKLYRAGSDYVLALSDVVGRMLALNVLEEEIITPGERIDMIKAEVPKLVGEELQEFSIRDETGCTAVAVEREGRILTDLEPDFVIEEGDKIVVAGTDDDIERFTSTFCE
jgi:Trk K+ transport system NAD-binding subunit